MKKNIKLAIVMWFFVSSALLAVSVLKAAGLINRARIISKTIKNYFSVYTPDVLALCDFESQKDFYDWHRNGCFIRQSGKHVYSGSFSAELSFVSVGTISSESSGVLLENYDLGPKGEKDWSRFRFLKLAVYNPQESNLPFYVKVKDMAGRSVEKIFDLREGDNQLSVDFMEAGRFIDLSNIAYLNLYFRDVPNGHLYYLDNIRLDRGGLKEKRILGRPVVNFLRMSCPKEVKKGTSITFSAFLSVSQKLDDDYQAFIHITHYKEVKKWPALRKYYVSINQDPWVATSKWAVNTEYEIGPLTIYIPENFPAGYYVIQIGLFNPESHGSHYPSSGREGMFDFRSGSPRLRFTNHELEDYIAARVRVLN